MNIFDQYEVVIGLEVHVQLSTRSKAFCSDDASFGGDPNTHISAISLGLPGTLPRLNKRQVEYAVRIGLALNSEINRKNYFDRKNYFYSDLPKGYQITQDKQPICIGGNLEIETENGPKKIRIHHVHMEEDAGKSIHDLDPTYSFIDLNRAGVPLVEIVTEPDFRSAAEVDTFMNQMRQLVRYLEVSDGNMEQGSMRCDCNISVRKKGATTYGERCEVKNVNSMRFARRAIEFEFTRQIGLLESGGKVAQQTLNFDPVTGITSPLRDKENAHDYRYFPEPDLPPVILSAEYINEIKSNMATLPWVLKKQFQEELNLSAYDAELLTEGKSVALFFLDFTKIYTDYKSAANLVINKILPWLNDQGLGIKDFPVGIENLSAFLQLIDENQVSSAIAYQRIFPVMIEKPKSAPFELAKTLNLIQSTDTGFLESLVTAAIANYPDKVADYRNGKKGLIGFFMGEVMKKSKGKAEPKTTNMLLRRYLEGND
ncbi:MAG: aspartyl-tRNA(Asn)/glutamyl-tRNA(Gln) amidotransferase subunit B [Saprospiraceae bacterium]|jgi:aspartyl-tRNA(Asn)/glutamyl-tRNA(Gln) amidotransferase subunit B